MGGVLSIRMNDAVRLLGVLGRMADIEPPGGLATGLRELLASGIVRRTQVLTWANSQGDADSAPASFPGPDRLEMRRQLIASRRRRTGNGNGDRGV
jgi:hypothetical protein